MTPQCVWLREIAIRDFRNLERVELQIPERGLALVGENGQGKTNFLEAIYYLQLLRSVRGATDPELVRFGAEGFHIGVTATLDRARAISVGFEKSGKRKKITLDGVASTRMSDSLGALPSVIFSPRDHELVAGGPVERRRYLDIVLAVTSRPYLTALQAYRATLARRNAVIRDLVRRKSGRADENEIAVWEPALADAAARLSSGRREWVERVQDEFAKLCVAVGERSSARLRYISTIGDSADAAGEWRAAFQKQRSSDLRRGMTQCGPHRDDLELSLDGRDIRVYGSAGQQRTAAIALRMLEASTLRLNSGLQPLLLLDDPFAELDVKRSSRILSLLMDQGLGQTILAVPRETDIPSEMVKLERRNIADGRITVSGS
ncbi:MAG: DNA replication and repair protein RecF [Gemmatimonadaceae bacterium]|nr:DNA replication and repair protein RecF [Gemmatimonadaceae bacterium]